MRYIKQFCIILAISFAGEALNHWIPLPVPASIYGILILFIGLETGWIPYDSVKETGKFLVDIMPVMFIPAAVGLLNSWEILQKSWFSYLVIILVSTVAVMAVSAGVTQFVIRREKKKKEGGEDQ